MRVIILCLTIIYVTFAQLCAQNDSLIQILDDIQDDDSNLNSWLEILSEQMIFSDQSAKKMYPKISLTHRFQYTLEKSKALSDHIFIGSPFESYTKLQISLYKNISAGALIQKDVGELSYFDHYSGYISWNHPNRPYKIILGNYYIRCAEGLLLSGPFALPKSALVKKPSSNRYLQSRPFLSSNEYDGFLGGVLEIGNVNFWKLISFYSQTLRDGIFNRDTNSITGFDRTGYHRTFSEQTKANLIMEKTYGGIISFPAFFLDQIGLVYVRTHYFPEISRNQSPDEQRKKYFDFFGSFFENYSLFYAKDFHTLRFSGEIAPIKLKKISYISTLNVTPSDWQLVLKSWYIPSQFQSPHGRVPSDSDPFPKSMHGFMLGATGNLLSDLKITTYWSLKQNLWRSYFQPLPVQKKEFYILNEYQSGPTCHFSLRYHTSFSDVYSSENQEKTKIIKQSFRIHIKQQFSTKVRIQTRFEKVILTLYPTRMSKNGINIYQDLSWVISKSLTFQIRFSAFNTKDYDSRIYEYENDLPNVFSNYAMYGRGRKWYVMVVLIPIPQIKLWMKYRRIFYDGINVIGSGLTSIAGDMRQDIHLQLEIRY